MDRSGSKSVEGCQVLDSGLMLPPRVPQWLRTAIEDALNDHAFDLIEIQQDQEAASKDDADYHAKF